MFFLLLTLVFHQAGICSATVLEYIVSIKIFNETAEGYSHICTGTILGQKWVLTAGHCFENKIGVPYNQMSVDAGSRYLKNGRRHEVEYVVVHPTQCTDEHRSQDDLALVLLKDPIIYTSSIQPVHFGTIKDQDEVPVLAGGWGTYTEDSDTRERIRFIEMRTMNLETCKRLHAKRGNEVDGETQICAFRGPGKSFCYGDSGAPLIDPERGYQVGVLSASEDCSGEFPTLFMKVEVYIGWINDITELELELD